MPIGYTYHSILLTLAAAYSTILPITLQCSNAQQDPPRVKIPHFFTFCPEYTAESNEKAKNTPAIIFELRTEARRYESLADSFKHSSGSHLQKCKDQIDYYNVEAKKLRNTASLLHIRLMRTRDLELLRANQLIENARLKTIQIEEIPASSNEIQAHSNDQISNCFNNLRIDCKESLFSSHIIFAVASPSFIDYNSI